MSVQTPEELQTNLDEYRGQLEQVTLTKDPYLAHLSVFALHIAYQSLQVDELLTLDPGNAEYQDLHASLLEVWPGKAPL